MRVHSVDDIQGAIVVLTERIQKILEKTDSVKRDSPEIVSRKIEDLENDLVVSSYSVQQTREVLGLRHYNEFQIEKQLEALRKELAAIKQQITRQEEVRQLREVSFVVWTDGQEKKESFIRLNQIRREINELDNAIHVSTVIIDARRRGETVTPDEVHKEVLKMKEECFTNLQRKHSRQVSDSIIISSSFIWLKRLCMSISHTHVPLKLVSFLVLVSLLSKQELVLVISSHGHPSLFHSIQHKWYDPLSE